MFTCACVRVRARARWCVYVTCLLANRVKAEVYAEQSAHRQHALYQRDHDRVEARILRVGTDSSAVIPPTPPAGGLAARGGVEEWEDGVRRASSREWGGSRDESCFQDLALVCGWVLVWVWVRVWVFGMYVCM